MEGRRCRRRLPRRNLPPHALAHDTAFIHRRLQAVTPLELHAHVSRVACCAVVAGISAPLRRSRDVRTTRTQQLCVVSGDAMGNLSVFYLSVPAVCSEMHLEENVDAGQRLRIRPDVRVRNAHRGSINCMRQLEDTPMLLTGGDDGAVRLWNVQEERIVDGKLQCVQEFLFHSSCVLACDVDPSQTFVASAGLDGIVAIWLLGVPIPLLTIAVGEPCFRVSIIPADPSLIQITHKDRVSVWDIRTQPHYLHFQRALFARIRERISQSSTDKWRVSVSTIQRVFSNEDSLSSIREFHQTEMCLSSMSATKQMRTNPTGQIFDEVTRRFVTPFEPHESTAHLLRAQPTHEGRMTLTSATECAHKLWNARAQQGVVSFECPDQQNHATSTVATHRLLIAPGSLCHQQRFLYGADSVGRVHVWDFRNSVTTLERHGETVVLPIHTLHGHAFFVTSLVLSHDDTVLVTGDASGKLHVRIAI